MQDLPILVVGAGIGGLSAAIALRRAGHRVTVIEKDPNWSVYGVGIIQQSNVIRAMDQLGVLDSFLDAACGFDAVEIYVPDGTRVARVPTPSLVEGKPSNVGIGRRALQKVLGDSARDLGAEIRLGLTVTALDQDADGVDVTLSDGSRERYAVVVGADGVYSQTRQTVLPQAEKPQFTGQAVWRYNFPRPADLDALHVYNGRTGVGLVPISAQTMYMYVTTPEPDNPRYPTQGIAEAMRSKLVGTAPQIQALASQITDDDGVVYRPLEGMMLHGPWHQGRVVLLGDAVHATTPHLGQGAGMAIEDAIVLAQELTAADSVEAAFTAYRTRRYERCRYIVESSLAICMGQLGKAPPVDNHKATAEMFAVVAQPI
ncbi:MULTISPECIES: FAD-dependent oxidoreductase [unclassified Novosphingobium]|uniref:FAD-dependent oxidoreductase n=1 Tax=unclassified Novosphingobium TaxID=2644732 RepID=UPI00144684DB|nr:2-polyprenyl-6-methoxyphenol hydroxylase-like FAD-dependent oxidoreductase [Novosphingobium sp. SG720]NMN06545.1 2-polyprenyl-6-methoxyphenol hydroxylase-like FAD-dependent oxidoreductase [Novosphingobium sp. SG919]NMN89006.1 2-polyprenyl-6-methoxyphenol hydroxylase-like FAD-dependent oxidoreductase [Novosphingobium sp. SG916]